MLSPCHAVLPLSLPGPLLARATAVRVVGACRGSAHPGATIYSTKQPGAGSSLCVVACMQRRRSIAQREGRGGHVQGQRFASSRASQGPAPSRACSPCRWLLRLLLLLLLLLLFLVVSCCASSSVGVSHFPAYRHMTL